MIKELFFEAKTIPEAVEKAAATLGLDKDLMTYEVVTMPVKGIFGIGAVNAKIKVEQEVPDEKKPEAPKKEKKPEAFVEKIAKKDNPVAKEKAPAKPKAPKAKKEPAPVIEVKPLEIVEGEVPDAIKEFLSGALNNMGLTDAEIEVGKGQEKNSYEVRVAGSHMGVLIGRRGDTLDAMQYMISLVLNRKFDDKIRITLDTENYRAKRIAALTSLAEKTAAKALKYKKNMTLEPMSPYERRIIHATLSGRDHITTASVGSEPRRRVVVTYVK
ncbi:MAG: KH domain-containing protein [Clostridia bacterium]|nr:KH domain-containing protein [Clostridia bacterium]